MIQALQEDERIQAYHLIKEGIQADVQLNALWEEQKQIQKELVHAKTYNLTQQKAKQEKELVRVEAQLSKHPLMRAYNEAYEQVIDIQSEIEEIVFSE